MSELRKLNTGDARTIRRPPQEQPGAAGSGRSVRTAQAHGSAPAPAPTAGAAAEDYAPFAYKENAYQQGAYQQAAYQQAAYQQGAYRQPQPQAAARQDAYRPRTPSYGAAPARPQAEPDAYEQARRRAQADADQTARLRRIQQGAARAKANTHELTPAQRQAIAMRRAAQQPAKPAVVRPRTDTARGQGYAQPAPPPQAGAAPAPRHIKPAPAAGPAGGAAKAPSGPPHKPGPEGGKKPTKAEKQPQGGKKGKGKGGKGGGGKKRKLRWWQIALITLLIILLILGGSLLLIFHSIAPPAGALSLSNLFNTPKEFQGKELNLLVIGVDRSMENGDEDDKDVGDGNTDMIMYVHFNNETGEMKMLQIPRDYFVGPDRSVSRNYRINNVAMTQAAKAGTLNVPALCEQVSNMFQVPIDGYVSIRMEMLTELVDAFQYVELYIPQTISYGGSKLEKGYRLLRSDQVEFLLRNRKSYPNGDIGRLNMQRQFYSALFTRLKSMTMWEVAKVVPVVLSFMETDLSIGKLTSFAVSMLKLDSSKVMICQMPVYMGLGYYKGEAVVYPARQQAADLLNQYFRENTGPVEASALQLADDAVNTSGATATDPNVQYMQALNQQQADAAINDNPDGVYTIDYDKIDTGAASQPPAQSSAASEPAA